MAKSKERERVLVSSPLPCAVSVCHSPFQVSGNGRKEQHDYLGLLRKVDEEFFILFNGEDEIRDWLGFPKNSGLQNKEKT